MTSDKDNTIKPDEQDGWNLDEEIQRIDKLHQEDIDNLRNFATSLPNVEPYLLTEQLFVALLHSAEYDVEQAKRIVTRYFEIRLSLPDIFTGRDLDSDVMKAALEVGYYVPLPVKTPDGFRVVLQALRKTDTALFNHQALCKVQTLVMDSLIHEDPTCAGYVFVCDMQGVSMGHIWKQSLVLGKKLMTYSQEGVPMIISQLHVLNTSSFTHKIMRLFKPFLSQRLWDMISLYSPEEIEEFLKKVPRECMPKDYGGKLPDTETLHQEEIKWLRRASSKLKVI